MMATLPAGSIIMFSGSNIPAGWLLCDGSNGTPNLANRFILPAEQLDEINVSNELTLSGSGGDKSCKKTTTKEKSNIHVSINDHTLTIKQIPPHSHRYFGFGGNNIAVEQGSWYGKSSGLETSSVGDGEPHNHGSNVMDDTHDHSVDVIIPYYILAFIIYVG